MKIKIDEATKIWNKLQDIPFNDEGESEEDFLIWPSGTSRLEIWSDIESAYDISIFNEFFKGKF